MENRRIPREALSAGKASVLQDVARTVGTPTYVYFQGDLNNAYDKFARIPAPDSVVVRYAMKANPNAAVLRNFDRRGSHFDASTFNEVVRAVDGPAGIDGNKIRLTSQEVQTPDNLKYLANHGVLYTASSLRQLDTYGQVNRGAEVGVRFNVGIGSGWNAQTSTGGESSSFGIYAQRDEIDKLLVAHNLTLSTVHLHIGSGSNPEKQKEAMQEGLALVRAYSDVTRLDMGGGFKVARMGHEQETDIQEMGRTMSEALQGFKDETGRKVVLEVEPGTALVANAGYIVTRVLDEVSTGSDGYDFLKVDGGMHTNARPPMYGAEHPLFVIPPDRDPQRNTKEYVVAGVCCESGDVLTVQPGDPDHIQPRLLAEAHEGYLVVVGGAGAYTASMAPFNYNSQENPAEVMVRENGKFDVVREREKVHEIWRHERVPENL